MTPGPSAGLFPGGRLRTGTSGFAYPAWAPRFYAVEVRDRGRLSAYADRLDAVELNNTFYARPKRERIAAWTAAVPEDFRFVVKAQRGSTFRALAGDPGAAIAWLLDPMPAFGPRLGAVLFRVDERMTRDDARLAGLLGAWPRDVPLVAEFQHASWHVDETFDALRAAGAVLCTTDLDGAESPPIRRTGPFLYLRLRRAAYDDAALESWAARLAPFLDDGLDAYVVFRHDDDGTSAVRALEFPDRVAAHRR